MGVRAAARYECLDLRYLLNYSDAVAAIAVLAWFDNPHALTIPGVLLPLTVVLVTGSLDVVCARDVLERLLVAGLIIVF